MQNKERNKNKKNNYEDSFSNRMKKNVQFKKKRKGENNVENFIRTK